MGAEVTGIEDTPPVNLDQEHVGVKRRVVRQECRHKERSALQRLSAFPVPEGAINPRAEDAGS